MKKKRLALLALPLAGAFALGAAAAGGVQQITAYLRPDVTVELDGYRQVMTDRNGNTVYPVEYNGSTYLPIRALGEMLGQQVVWNPDTLTVALSARTGTPAESLSPAALRSRMTALENRYASLAADLRNTDKASSYAENQNRYGKLEERREAIEDAATFLLIDCREARYGGTLTASEYQALQDRLATLEDQLDTLKDSIRTKFGVYEDGAKTEQALRGEADRLDAELTALRRQVANVEAADSKSDWKTRDNEARADWRSFRTDVRALQLALNDSLRRDVIGYTAYDEIRADADALDTASKELGDRLDRAQARWDGTATQPGAEPSGKDYEGYLDDLAALETDSEALLTDAREFFTSKTQNRDAYRALEKRLDTLDDRADRLEDAVEDSRKLSRQQAHELLSRLDKVENKLDQADNFLDKAEDRYDDDHDDDDHDDWDD